MNRELRALLADAGVSTGAWSDIILLHNVAALPAPDTPRGDYIWNRGFNLLVLDARGHPAHYCKCRRPDDEDLAHDTRVREVLARDPALRAIVPATRGVASGTIQIQVSHHLTGEPFSSVVARLSTPAWERAVGEILTAVEGVTARSAELLPDLAAPAGGVALAQEVTWALRHLGSAGVPPDTATRLARVLEEAGRAPAAPQHGDLWPGNVVRFEGSWWLLDFEVFGRIRIPLYDAFHLVRTSWQLRPGGALPLLALLRDRAAGAACRTVLGAAVRRAGLTRAQLGGAFVAYLVDIAARLHRRGVPSAYWLPYVAGLQRLDDDLAAGTPLEDLVPL